MRDLLNNFRPMIKPGRINFRPRQRNLRSINEYIISRRHRIFRKKVRPVFNRRKQIVTAYLKRKTM